MRYFTFAALSLLSSQLAVAYPNRPVPIVSVIPGTTVTVPVSDYTQGKILSVSPALSDWNAEISPSGVAISCSSGTLGMSAVHVQTSAGDLDVIVRATPKPVHRFIHRGSADLKSVGLAGSFNGWSPTRDLMTYDSDLKAWRLDRPMEPGSYEYKIVADGKWITDDENPDKKSDGYQGFNSILTIRGGGSGTPARLVRVPSQSESAVTWRWLGATDVDDKSVMAMVGDRLASASVTRSAGHSFLSVVLPALPSQSTVVRSIASDVSGTVAVGGETLLTPSGKTWRDETLYFVFTDRFSDGDPKNNNPVKDAELGALANYLGGDWAGLRKKVDEGYFKKLGVTALWISPPQKQAEGAWKDAVPPNRKYTSYHGYWPAESRETNPHFGSADELKKLVDTAHRNNIKMVMDLVANHVHLDHPYAKQHPEWFGTYNLPDGRKNLRLFDEFPLTTWFDTFLPKFDYDKNPDAVKTQVADAIWWLETFRFDGFRHDATKHIPHVYWRALTKKVREVEQVRKTSIYQVGESILGRDGLMEWVNPAELDGQFDFPLYWSIRGSLATEKDGMDQLGKSVEESLLRYGVTALNPTFVGNHDFARFVAFATGGVKPNGEDEKERAWENVPTDPKTGDAYARLRNAFTLILTLPQIPVIYYGDEIGLTGAGDPDNRRMMKFEKELSKEQQATLRHVQLLGTIRSKHSTLRRGDYVPVYSSADQLVYMLCDERGSYLIGINRAKSPWGGTISVPPLVQPGSKMDPLLEGGSAAWLDGQRLKLSLPAQGSWIIEFRANGRS